MSVAVKMFVSSIKHAKECGVNESTIQKCQELFDSISEICDENDYMFEEMVIFLSRFLYMLIITKNSNE